MEADNITIWLDKYWEGTSTLEEEKNLRLAFSHGKVPAELERYREYFTGLDQSSEDSLLDPDFDEMILAQIEQQESGKKIKSIKRYGIISNGWRFAASILLAAGAFIALQQLPSAGQGAMVHYDSAGQEAEALEQTTKALKLVATKLNKGTEETARASQIIESTSRSLLKH